MLNADDGSRLECSVAVERVGGASSGHAVQRRSIRRALIVLGRDEFRELQLRVQDTRGGPPESFPMRQFCLHTRFIKDGKCTVSLAPVSVQLLISDCPPDRLKTFLKTLSIKHEASKDTNPLSERARMRAALPRVFETISPVQVKDVQKANELRSKVNAPLQIRKGLSERSGNRGEDRRQPVKRARTDADSSPVCSSLRIFNLDLCQNVFVVLTRYNVA